MNNPVEDIYNTLFEFEKRRDKKGEGYPIHKKLKFENPEITDIYQWLIKHIDFSSCTKILDAGCGVGFGTLLIAQHTKASLTGISISDLEIDRANNNALQQNLTDKVNFYQASFEEAPGENYDMIIAIESLKHSYDLENTLPILVSKLSSSGVLIIIEDFYTGPPKYHLAEAYNKDWNLKSAYRYDDYTSLLHPTKIIDLTPKMPKKNSLALVLRQFWLNTLSLFNRSNKLYKIFRGGIYLDRLYSENKMEYGCLMYANNSEDA